MNLIDSEYVINDYLSQGKTILAEGLRGRCWILISDPILSLPLPILFRQVHVPDWVWHHQKLVKYMVFLKPIVPE